MRVIQRICSILLLLVTFGASALYTQTYDKLWKRGGKQAQKKGLPRTVIKLADEIYRKGRQEQKCSANVESLHSVGRLIKRG